MLNSDSLKLIDISIFKHIVTSTVLLVSIGTMDSKAQHNRMDDDKYLHQARQEMDKNMQREREVMDKNLK